MGEFVAAELGIDPAEAKRVQKRFYIEHGTTLAGLMKVHKVEPKRFLAQVHDIDYSPVPAAPELARALQRLPGRRIIFTNGSRRHAERVADRLGITHLFSDIFDISDADYVPKPHQSAYDSFLTAHGVEASTSAMFEDLPQNLAVPHEVGMTTVLVHTHLDDHPIYREVRQWGDMPPPHIHHRTTDLSAFLTALAPHSR
jgi:putative hydrolase of the HAD superfamily